MKQKVVIRVQMTNEKFRKQVMKSAASKYGVISVAIEGPDKDQLVVTGEGIDVVNLTSSIQKKCLCATLLRVEKVEPTVEPAAEPTAEPAAEPTVEPAVKPSVEQPNNLIVTFSPMPAVYHQYPQPMPVVYHQYPQPMPAVYCQYPQFPKCYQLVYDQDPYHSCSMM